MSYIISRGTAVEVVGLKPVYVWRVKSYWPQLDSYLLERGSGFTYAQVLALSSVVRPWHTK